MNDSEKQIARIMFQNKIYQSDGIVFEKLFSNLMNKIHPDFQQVKPQGNVGDRKNDGWVKSEGIYYQVYAPEVLEKNIKTAGDKAKDDFKGLHDYWNTISPIKKYYFVMNDKFNGTSPTLEGILADLKLEYPTIEFNSIIARQLENKFMNLSTVDIIDLIGIIPDLQDIYDLDISVLTEVIQYLVPKLRPYSIENANIEPDYIKKIEFNKLGEMTSGLLKTAYYQIGVLEEYFQVNGDFVEARIKEKMNQFYTEGRQKFNLATDSDNIFFYIFQECSPRQDKSVHDAVLVVMSKYFEACDIFEEPK